VVEERPARWEGGMPLRETSRLLGGRDVPRGTSRPLDGRDAAVAALGAFSRIRNRGPREGPGKYFGTSRPLDGRKVSGKDGNG
jgi:hypothetical protein